MRRLNSGNLELIEERGFLCPLGRTSRIYSNTTRSAEVKRRKIEVIREESVERNPRRERFVRKTSRSAFDLPLVWTSLASVAASIFVKAYPTSIAIPYTPKLPLTEERSGPRADTLVG